MKSGCSGEVVERTLDQFADRLFRRQALQIELAFMGPDFLVDPFQHRKIERVLVAEIMIDQLLVDAGTLGDFVDPGAGKAAPGEFAPCCRQQLAPCGRRIAPLRLCAV